MALAHPNKDSGRGGHVGGGARRVATADADGVRMFSRNGGHGPSRCDERRSELYPETSRAMVEVVEHKDRPGRLQARVLEILESSLDGSPSPDTGEVMDFLPSGLFPLVNDQRGRWYLGAQFAVDCSPNKNPEWESEGYTQFVTGCSHLWCCALKSRAKRGSVEPPTESDRAEGKAEVVVASREEKFLRLMAQVKEIGATNPKIKEHRGWGAAKKAAEDYKNALKDKGKDSWERGQAADSALGRLSDAVTSMAVPTAIEGEMDQAAIRADDTIADVFG